MNRMHNRHPNVKFTVEKQINHPIAFLDVFISGINNENRTLQTYRKSTYTGLLFKFTRVLTLKRILHDFRVRLV